MLPADHSLCKGATILQTPLVLGETQWKHESSTSQPGEHPLGSESSAPVEPADDTVLAGSVTTILDWSPEPDN